MAQKRPMADESSVYVVAAGEGLYKVGCTTRPVRRRVAELNVGARAPLTVVTTVPVPTRLLRSCEACAHAALADAAAPDAGGTEFFRAASAAEISGRVETACRDFVAAAEAVRHDVEALPIDGAAEAALPLFDERRRIAAQVRSLQLRQRLVEEALLQHFHEPLCCQDGRPLLRWQERTQARFDLAAFKAHHPELALTYTEERSQRALTVC